MDSEATIAELLALEAIKSLKARYFRTMDTKDWAALSGCFTEDLVADFRDAPGTLIHGREDYMTMIADVLKDATTVHHGHMPEITIDSATAASGIWAMEDIVEMAGMKLQGWGHYHETCRRQAGHWRIASIRLTRLKLVQAWEPL